MSNSPNLPVPDTLSRRHSRAIDHAVLPVESLETARRRLTVLGFTVAPDAIHPFGTENCCIYLPDGTYLEPLAVAQRETCEAEARMGNVFVARDQAFRFRNGANGFSALAFGTRDAGADEKAFVAAGISGGKNLTFSRSYIDAKGGAGTARFALAFACDLRSPDCFFFTCQRLGDMPARSQAATIQANGVVRLSAVVASEPNPSDFQYLLQGVIGDRETRAHSFGIDIEAAGAEIMVLNRDGMRIWFGTEIDPATRGLRLSALVFAVRSMERLKALLAENSVATREQAGRLIVDPAPGQGALFAFEETQ